MTKRKIIGLAVSVAIAMFSGAAAAKGALQTTLKEISAEQDPQKLSAKLAGCTYGIIIDYCMARDSGFSARRQEVMDTFALTVAPLNNKVLKEYVVDTWDRCVTSAVKDEFSFDEYKSICATSYGQYKELQEELKSIPKDLRQQVAAKLSTADELKHWSDQGVLKDTGDWHNSLGYYLYKAVPAYLEAMAPVYKAAGVIGLAEEAGTFLGGKDNWENEALDSEMAFRKGYADFMMRTMGTLKPSIYTTPEWLKSLDEKPWLVMTPAQYEAQKLAIKNQIMQCGVTWSDMNYMLRDLGQREGCKPPHASRQDQQSAKSSNNPLREIAKGFATQVLPGAMMIGWAAWVTNNPSSGQVIQIPDSYDLNALRPDEIEIRLSEMGLVFLSLLPQEKVAAALNLALTNGTLTPDHSVPDSVTNWSDLVRSYKDAPTIVRSGGTTVDAVNGSAYFKSERVFGSVTGGTVIGNRNVRTDDSVPPAKKKIAMDALWEDAARGNVPALTTLLTSFYRKACAGEQGKAGCGPVTDFGEGSVNYGRMNYYMRLTLMLRYVVNVLSNGRAMPDTGVCEEIFSHPFLLDKGAATAAKLKVPFASKKNNIMFNYPLMQYYHCTHWEPGRHTAELASYAEGLERVDPKKYAVLINRYYTMANAHWETAEEDD